MLLHLKINYKKSTIKFNDCVYKHYIQLNETFNNCKICKIKNVQ